MPMNAKSFKTYDPLGMKRGGYFYAFLIIFLIIITLLAYFIPPTGRIVFLSICLIFIVIVFLLGKFYKYRYNGGAEVIVTKESVEIKLPNSQKKVFSINSIKKIKSQDNSSIIYYPEATGAPILLTLIIWTSSPLGKVRLRFMDATGKSFLKELLKYKKPKRKSSNIFLRLIHDNLEMYRF